MVSSTWFTMRWAQVKVETEIQICNYFWFILIYMYIFDLFWYIFLMYSELIISGHEVQWHKKIPVKCPNQYRAYGFLKDDAAQAVVDAIKARRREVHAACCVCEIPRYFTRSKSRPRCGPHMSYLSHGTCEIDMADFDMAHMKSDEAPRTWGRDWNLWMLTYVGPEMARRKSCAFRSGTKRLQNNLS